MASTGGSEAEFHDLRRRELLQALSDALPTDIIRPTAWACLWLSDIEKLKELLAEAQKKPTAMVILFEGMEVLARIVPTWTQRKRPASAASTPLQPSTPQRPITPLQPPPSQQPPSAQGSRGKKRNSSGHTRSKCHQRDQRKCILTKAGEPNEVAHIYPFSMRDEYKERGFLFWDTLRMFWSKERVDAWYDAIFPIGTEVCQNLVCLAPHAHVYWERAYFALKPIRMSDDKKRLDIQFFWLSVNPRVTGVNVSQVPLLPANLDQGPNLVKLFNNETDTKIHSGCEISLKTDDPALRPLPDFRLLEMQWFLHRVTAISGAAELQDDFYDNDSDDDIATASQNRWNMYTEDDWDMDIEEGPATYSPTQLPGIQTFGHMVTLRGGEDREGEDREGEDREGEDREDREGEDREGEDREGEDREGEDHKDF
ncbi:hypothetical protein K469DRAFT_754850 [Zopfia rhizophila CBS 207.26]|uniref:HNH nuclease domain-containing protein n=1 Tax=Zopfia rhizophila CBS 207.26 TaxID=1314779 RepID=A0A6A6DG18_9PEZI|nr:hypothetical protein K469DRAFT_754850 [Zopfia rhizophila CBS 207.26]